MVRRLVSLTAMLMAGCASVSTAQAGETVRVRQGVIDGTTDAASGVRVFKGVPFAAPPVGDLRWRAPQPAAPWSGVRAADQWGPRCLQHDNLGNIDPNNPRMDEDCLYLNVWVPKTKAGARLPVMVWLYGGGFTAGSGSEPWYDGANLAKRGVIVVTVNYRLDVFGFLAHPALTAEGPGSGEYGLLDQVAALKWVRDNIAAFGGDPAQVTLFGESAGAVSVSALTASPVARGLFQRAIAQSGSALIAPGSPYALPSRTEAEKTGLALAETLGVETLAEMRAKPAQTVFAAVPPIKRSLSDSFGPVIGGTILPEDPGKIFAEGRQNRVPLIIGWTADEGSLFNFGQPGDPKAFGAMASRRFGAEAGRFASVYPATTSDQAKASADALMGDELVGHAGWRWSELAARTGGAPVYRFLFDHRPPAPPFSVTPLAAPGAFHSADVVYAFDNLQVRDWPFTAGDRRLADIMASYWVNFAKRGDPNAAGLPQWPAYEAGGSGKVMRLNPDAAAAPEPRRAQFQFLDDAYRAASSR